MATDFNSISLNVIEKLLHFLPVACHATKSVCNNQDNIVIVYHVSVSLEVTAEPGSVGAHCISHIAQVYVSKGLFNRTMLI